jgi:peroxiredoxin
LCNRRIHELVNRYPELGGSFQVVAVFDSSLENLRKHTAHHQAPFPILADPLRETFYWYGVEHSFLGVCKGLLTRMHRLLYAVLVKGYLPFTIQERITSMPADFLVGGQGIIRVAHYGKDEGGHLSFSAIRRFAGTSNG